MPFNIAAHFLRTNGSSGPGGSQDALYYEALKVTPSNPDHVCFSVERVLQAVPVSRCRSLGTIIDKVDKGQARDEKEDFIDAPVATKGLALRNLSNLLSEL